MSIAHRYRLTLQVVIPAVALACAACVPYGGFATSSSRPVVVPHAPGELAASNQRGFGNQWDPISWRPVLFTGSIIDAGRAPPSIGSRSVFRPR
jgi:hypothetical protein